MEAGIHTSIPSSCSKHNRKINIFSVQAGDLETRAETHNFSLKKVSGAQLFGARKSILRMSERFVSNITGDIIFSTRLDKINICNDLPTLAETQLFLEVKTTKRERCTIKTLINNYLVKERALYRLNERFVSNITGDILFFDKVGTPYRHLKISISQVTCRRVPKHRTFPWSKI